MENWGFVNAGVVKLVNTRDLKSLGFGLAGSSPAAGTTLSKSTNDGYLMLRFGAAPSSVSKLHATELHKAITVLALEADPFGALAQRKHFATRAATIHSGTSEIHRNILAKAIGCLEK